jgi:DNA modification methylase
MNRILNINVLENEDWSFKGVDTKYLTHGLHPYPARMIPQVARRLLLRFGEKGSYVLDPFCGSGTVLVEARLCRMNAVGIDINPLACLLARVKSTPIDPDKVLTFWRKLKEKIREEISLLRFGQIDIEPPKFPGINLNYWYKPITQKELTIIRRYLENIDDEESRWVFEIAFSRTAREASTIKKGEFKLVRMPKGELDKFYPNVLDIFINCVEETIEKIREFYKISDKSLSTKVFLADTKKMFTSDFPQEANQILLDNPPKIIVTSPPYGDSRTTVAYGQFSRLPSIWLNFEGDFKINLILSVDKLSLGGNNNILNKLNSPTLHQILAMIERNDSSRKPRRREVLSYFSDLYICLEKMYDALCKGGHACIVIANRTVKRVQIPTHIIISEMAVEIGFENDITIIPRNIPTKRLPWENAPENIPGLKGKTMSMENIIILRKTT